MFAAAGLLARRRRKARLAHLRAAWGERPTRTHKLAVLDATHQSRAACEGTSVLDARTADDLNLGDVFCEIDRTTSTLGQDALYHRLHALSSADALPAFESLVTLFSEDAAVRERAQLALTRLQDPNGYNVWWLGGPGAIISHRWHALFPVLTVLTVAAGIATVLSFSAWHVLAALIITNLTVWFIARLQIAALSLALRQIAPIVATGGDLAFLAGEGRVVPAGMAEDAAALRRLKHVSRWLSGDPLMMSFRLDGTALLVTAVATIVYEYLNIALLLDANGVLLATSDLRRHGHALVRLAAAVGDVDAALSVASWRAGLGDWTRPGFCPPGSPTCLENARHPLVTDAVPNTLALAAGRGMLVTGSNMSGKSTFLRTVGVNVVLAQRLNTCLASRYVAPFFSVRTCIGRTDDLLSGKSYYLAEVEAVMTLVRAAANEHPHLFIFDELFRGTNTVERVSAAQAVLAELVEQPDPSAAVHVVLAATHDGELLAMLRDRYDPYHFSDHIGTDGLTFEFRLIPGPATTHNAIALLARHGAPTRVIDRALASASAMDAVREQRGQAS